MRRSKRTYSEDYGSANTFVYAAVDWFYGRQRGQGRARVSLDEGRRRSGAAWLAVGRRPFALFFTAEVEVDEYGRRLRKARVSLPGSGYSWTVTW